MPDKISLHELANLPAKEAACYRYYDGGFVRASDIPTDDGPTEQVSSNWLNQLRDEYLAYSLENEKLRRDKDAWKANAQSYAASLNIVEEAVGQLLPAPISSEDHRLPEAKHQAEDIIAALHLVRDRLIALAGQLGSHPDDQAIDRFATAMKEKMRFAREVKGRGGWQDEDCTGDHLSSLLRGHLDKPNGDLAGGDPVDVANFCMMLHQRGERITARTAGKAD